MNGAIKSLLLIAMLLSGAATAFCDTYVDYLNRGNAKYDKGDWDGAIAEYNHAIELKSDYAAAYDNRGNAKRKKGDWEGAIADYTQAIDIKPNSGAPDGIGADVNGVKSDRENAISEFKKALSLDQRPDAALPYKNRGDVEFDRGDLDAALADYDQAIGLKPDFAEAYICRSMGKRDQGDLDGAMADCNKAIELNPELAWAFHTRGCLLYDSRDFKGALVDFRKEVDLVYSSDYARFRIWLIRSRLDDEKAATKELRTYLRTRFTGKSDDWDSKIGLFLAGQLAEPAFLAAAKNGPQTTKAGQICQSYFYAGSKHLLVGDKATATDYFRKSVATNQKACFEYISALADLKYLEPRKN